MNKKRFKLRILVSIGLLFLIACKPQSSTSSKKAMVDYFTDHGLSNAVKTTQHPAGEYYEGVTYLAYQGPKEDPYVVAYDHKAKTWSGPVKAGESIMGKTPGAKIDNHGKPAMIIDDEGYIHLVFGGHGGLALHGENPLGDVHNGQQMHVVSKKPKDISSWELLDNIPPFGTYNQFVKLDNGDIYLFYRHGAHRSNWVYQKSTDNGQSFASPVSILATKLNRETGINDSWYAWFSKGHGDEIMAVFNYHLCREDGAIHNGERHNGYYMVMSTDDHIWRNVKGEKLKAPITKEQADQLALVVDTKEKWTVRGTTAMDSEGKPHVTFYVGEHLGLRHGGPKEVFHYKWTGQKWLGQENTDLPVATGDMLISTPDNVSLLLAGMEEGVGEVAWWNSTDGGQSFEKGKVLLSADSTKFNVTSFFRNAHPNAIIIASGSDLRKDSPYRKMYLLGEQGAVKRLKSEADRLRAGS